MSSFEELLAAHRSGVERLVKYKIRVCEDAEDVLQDVYVTAFRKFAQLKNLDSFRPWLVSIARNRISDYFRAQMRRMEIPVDGLTESALGLGRFGVVERSDVSDALDRLGGKDAQILYLYYWKDMPQAEIAQRLDIPLGTVKSRLHTARRNFRNAYHREPKDGGDIMTKLPEFMPEYSIRPVAAEPFPVVWEELMGWLIVPKLGERLSWGLYDQPSRRRTEYTDMRVIGRAEVHGIEGVEISAVQYDAENYYRTGSIDEIERRFIAQLTDAHCRYLAESHMENGVRKVYTFLDGEAFTNNWGYGEDNCGSETHVRAKGILRREGDTVTGAAGAQKSFTDVVGRYEVNIGGKTYDTICLMDVEAFDDAIVTEQYLDKNGRTVLWRRFNRDDWAFRRYGKKWTEMLPDNQRLTVNGETYVHWYDCISDYIL